MKLRRLFGLGAKPNNAERERVFRQIKRYRRGEESKVSEVREGAEYVCMLGGVEHLFQYVRSLSAPVVLDVGAGGGFGLLGIREKFGNGLSFHATSLLKNSNELVSSLGKNNVHRTSVEILRGIPSGSIGCIIGVWSITFSASPSLATKSIDRILCPGGAIKTMFLSKYDEQVLRKDLQTAEAFVQGFSELGYGVTLLENQTNHFITARYDLVLAIKPGSTKKDQSAIELLNVDMKTCKEQALGLESRDY